MTTGPPRARRPTVIGVMGAGACDERIAELAAVVGRLIARRGAVLLTGGMGGVMEAAARGAREEDGLTVGVLPGRGALESPPNPHVELAIFTGMSDARNYVNVCSADAIIAIAGSWGTLSEIALARKLGKPVVALESWNLGTRLATAKTPVEAVEMVFAAVKEETD